MILKLLQTIIKNEYDFYRPFGKETPFGKWKLFKLSYLLQVKKAFDMYKEKVIKTNLIKLENDESIIDKIDYFNVHLPYRKMGEKALSYLLRHEWRSLPKWKQIISEVGMKEPLPKDPRGTIESILADKDFMQTDEQFRKAFIKTHSFQKVFNEKMSSSLETSAMIGNLYTASMYMWTKKFT